MTDVVLSVENVHKRFQKGEQKIHVLRGINLSIHAGESVAIVGQSGSGKSTFLQLLGFLDRPTTGELTFMDTKQSRMSTHQLDKLRNQSIGFIFQFHHLLPDHDALENVMMPLLISGRSKKEAYQRASELLQRVGLGERMFHKPGELSGGEQQRVAVARSLIASPKLILADEPTGNLDPQTSVDIMDLLLSLTSEIGGSLVMVTHNINLAQKCDRFLRLQEGLFVEET